MARSRNGNYFIITYFNYYFLTLFFADFIRLLFIPFFILFFPLLIWVFDQTFLFHSVPFCCVHKTSIYYDLQISFQLSTQERHTVPPTWYSAPCASQAQR